MPSDVPPFPANITTGCANVGYQGMGCQFILGDPRIVVSGIGMVSPPALPALPSTAPSAPGAPSLPPLPAPPGAAAAHGRARGATQAFVIDVRVIDPITGPSTLIGRCTGEAGCLLTFSDTQVALGTTIGCTLTSAAGLSGITCGSPSATTSAGVPSAPGVPSVPPSGVPTDVPSGGVPSVAPSGLPSVVPSLPAPVPGFIGQVCVATSGSPCTITAGSQADDVSPNGTTILTGRGSWIASGSWEIDVYHSGTCTGTPDKVYTSALNSNDPTGQGLAGANNGGGYYGSCVSATATGVNSFVLLGAGASPLLP